ncbi:MAG: apolipoprotein N-acyltransferase [Bacillota bacterium]
MNFLLIILTAIFFAIPAYFPSLFFFSWIAFIPLVIVIFEEKSHKAFVRAWTVGFFLSLFKNYWIYQPLKDFTSISAVFLVLVPVIYFIISGLWLGVWAFINNLVQPKYEFSPFIAAFIWSTLEFFRLEWIKLNPFDYLAYSQYKFNSLVQLSSVGGIILTGFVTVLLGGYLAKIYLKPSFKRSIPFIIIILIIVISPYIYFSDISSGYQYTEVDIITTEIQQKNKWDFENTENIISKIASMINESKNDLIFTPETSLTFDFNRNGYYRNLFKQKINVQEKYIQVGSRSTGDGEKRDNIYNSQFLINSELEILDRYNKNELFIFGEYMPYPDFVGSLTGYYTEDISWGENKRIFEIKNLKWLNLICSEIFFPVDYQNKDYDFIVNSGNEAWFRTRILKNMIWSTAVYRAVENRTSVVKVSNMSFSGCISPLGKDIKKTYKDSGVVSLKVPLTGKKSFYFQHGELAAKIISLFTILLIILKIVSAAKKKYSSS